MKKKLNCIFFSYIKQIYNLIYNMSDDNIKKTTEIHKSPLTVSTNSKNIEKTSNDSTFQKNAKIAVVFLVIIILLYVCYCNKERFIVGSERSDPSSDWNLKELDKSINSLNDKLQ